MKQKLLLTLALWLTLLGSAWAQSNALHFDGSNDYVDLPDFTTTHDFSQGFTFTAWVKWDAFTGNARVFEIGNGSGNVNNSIILRTDNSTGTLIFQCASGSTNSEIKTDAAVVTANKWHHVAATISSTGVANIYVDGTAVKSGSVSAPKNVTRANNWLGKSAWSVDNYFKGTMDEVSIWHKALTQADIEAIKQTSPTGNEEKLAAYYNFNQTTGTTLTDATTNAKHGTLTNFALTGTTSNWVAGYTPPTPPVANNSLHFDGSNDYVTCPAINPTQFTVEAWVYPTTLGKDQAIISTLNVSGKVGMELHIGTDNLPIITINNNGSFIDVKGTSTITADTWTHLAATYNGTNLKLFVNGTEAKSESYSSYWNGTAQVNLGKRYNEASYYFSGRIDEVRIWNTARTQTQIANAKNNPLAGTENNLLAYYSFNQGTAAGTNTGVTTLTGATANGKNGTLTNFALTGTTSNWVEGFVAGTTPTYNLSATPNSLMLGAANGSNGTITVTSNTNWEASLIFGAGTPWATVSPTSGNGNGTITITANSANTGTSGRGALLRLSGDDVESVNINLGQNAPVQTTLTYTLTDGASHTLTGNSLAGIFMSASLAEIKTITVTGGDFTTADWNFLKNNCTDFTELTDFTIASTINSVADVPSTLEGQPFFEMHGKLQSLLLHKVQVVGAFAFMGNNMLKTAVLPDVTQMDNFAFYGCSMLFSVSMPKITSIAKGAFRSCASLSNLLLGAIPPIVGSEVFTFCADPRHLSYADAEGKLITTNGNAWTNAYNAYKNANDGSSTDEFWYGWRINRPLYCVTVISSTNGTLTAGNPDAMVFGAYPAGTTINVTATANYGYKLKPESLYGFVTGNASLIEGIEDNKFVMPDKNITVTASFEPKLSVSTTTVTLGKEAGQSQMVTVISDNSHQIININERPDWLRVDIATNNNESAIAFITTEANPWAFEREVAFSLTAAEANDITITVKQEASPEVFTISKTKSTLGYQQGSTDIITITNNIPWSASTAPYSHLFSVSPTEGAGNAELTITALTENTSLADINGVISVNGETYPITQKFNAKQLSVSQTDILVGKEAGSTVQVQVTSDTDWWFDNTNKHFNVKPASGTGNATVTITANGAVKGHSNNISTPTLEGDVAYPVQFTITQKSDYMPLGDGTAANPFQISTLHNLRWMSENLTNESPYLSSHYALTNDIDAQESHHWPEGFLAISNNSTNYFAGTFNGKGYAISNLLTYRGLFFKTATEARIDSLALVNALVKGYGAAGLVYQNNGTINACYVTGYKAGEYVGMLTYSNSGTITNCYTSGFIAGSESAGLCYLNLGTISGSYTAVGCLYDMDNDGFVWRNYGTAHGYFNKELFAINRTPTAIGLTTAEMQQQAKFEGWDFANVWSITEGKSFPRLQGVYNYPLLLPTYFVSGIPNVPYWAPVEIMEMDYPVKSVELTKAPEGMELSNSEIFWTPKTGGEYDVTITITDTNGKAVAYTYTITVELWGSGTEANPYLIHTIAELDYMRNMQPDTYYLLMNDLDFAGTKYAYNPDYPERIGWQPIISAQENMFFSHFNGNGHVIKNLYINQPNRNELGLFGPCYNATIKNLGLVDVNITGNNYCGGLAGKISYSNITNCYVTGSIKGNENIGGLAGSIDNSTITSCHILGSVKGKNFIGGLVGSSNSSSTTAQCYTNATVEGDFSAGGLIGASTFASVSNSYTAGTVSGRKHVGGLIGEYFSTDFNSCYSASVATDSASYCGLSGSAYSNQIAKSYYLLEGNADVTNFEGTRLTAQQLMQQASFTDWDFTNIWQITEGQTLPRLRGMYNHPVVLPVADTAQINKPYTHTLRVVGMDNAVASVSISGVEGMTLSETDNTLTWTPATANEPTLTVTATDASGAVTHHRQRITVIPFNGEGTEESPYQITTIAQLNAVRNYSNKCFRLMNDLNFDGSEYSKANSQNGWLPIEKFTGKFYGTQHVIKNLYINRIDMEYTGLFGSIENAYISEVGLAGVRISGGDNTGAICGESSNAIITLCYVSGTIHGSDMNTGGLVGYSQGTTINDSYNTASIYAAGGYLGGIVGVNESSAVISQCYNAGWLYNDEMGYTGAIAGAHGSGIITDCRFDSDINPETRACGSVSTDAQINNTLGLTTEQMKQAANFAEWDFTTIWQIREGQTYPALRTINNAPFAFSEEINVGARHSLTNLLANDYDYETAQEKLVLRVLSMDGPGAITQNSYFAFPQGTAKGTTTNLKYMVGEVTAPGDTLWGGQAVVVMIKVENLAPEQLTLAVTIDEDTTLEDFDMVAGVTDPNNDVVTVVEIEEGWTNWGTATLKGNTITYVPNNNFNGKDRIKCITTDGEKTNISFLTITTTPVNDAPVLTAVTNKSIKQGETLTLTMYDVTANDVDDDELSLVIANGENYTVSGNTITPAESFTGTLSVGIAVTDGELTSNQMVMSVTVTTSTGIDDNKAATVNLYPNPCHNYVEIGEGAVKIRRVSFVNLAGQTVLVEEAPTGRIHVASLKPGIYLVKVEDDNGKTSVLRLVKQ